MLNNRYLLIIFTIIGIGVEKTSGQIKITIDQAIDSALARNLDLKKSNIDLQITKQELKSSKFNLLPTLNASNNNQLNFGRSVDPTTYTYTTNRTFYSNGVISSNATIFHGLEKLKQIQLNKIYLNAGLAGFEKIKKDLEIKTIAVYLSTLNFFEQMRANEGQIKVSELQLQNIKRGYNAGNKNLSDISSAEYQLNKTQLEKTTNEGQFKTSLLDLLQLMNINTEKDYILMPPVQILEKGDFDTTNAYDHSSIKKFPEVKEAMLIVEGNRKSLEIAKSDYYPSITLSGAIGSNFTHRYDFVPTIFQVTQTGFINQFNSNLYQYIGASIEIPIFNNLHTQIAINKAKLTLLKSQYDELQVEQNAYKILHQAKIDISVAKVNMLVAESAFQNAKETYRITSKRFESGLANSLNLIQAQDDMNRSELLVITSKNDLIFKEKTLVFYLGKSTNISFGN